ncbi:hypothetical protein HDU78_004382 [Chytriomyces hyalinus]|nr:hypothetical protein HDU78_004382 [Chytriomyces hyalinus]
MTSILSAFKAVSLIFAAAAVGTGLHAIADPVGFSKSFGLPISPPATPDSGTLKKDAVTGNLINTKDGSTAKEEAAVSSYRQRRVAMSYVSLMGVRQLATGTILLTFAYQGKWTEMATILAIIGILVAGTDGIYLSRDGAKKLGQFHALPGALISALACAFIWTES